MTSDLIERKDAIHAIVRKTIYDNVDQIKYECARNYAENNGWLGGLKEALEAIEEIPSAELERKLDELPSVETGIIHCCDCKWWDRLEDGHPYGYCRACRSGTHTERWEISIYRQNRYDFYCADAEPKENEDDDE